VLNFTQLSDDYADNEIEADGVHGAMHALTNMKHQYPHLKILLSIGGGGEGSTHFPTAARTDSSRHAFAKSAKHLIDIHGFDGIDSEWNSR
jgi:chitinase